MVKAFQQEACFQHILVYRVVFKAIESEKQKMKTVGERTVQQYKKSKELQPEIRI